MQAHLTPVLVAHTVDQRVKGREVAHYRRIAMVSLPIAPLRLRLPMGLYALEQVGLKVPLSRATQRQYEVMVEKGIGELDKSGIAELTFKGRMA